MSINKDSQIAPNLRFKGFTDDWEERKLGKIVEFYSGLTYSPDNIIPKGGTFVLRSSNVKNGELINADNVYVDSSFVNSSNVQIGDIVVVVRNGSRNLIGKHAQVKNYMENTVIGAFMTGIRAKEPNYINALLNTQQFKIEINKNLGATINQITTGAFKKMQFSITPNIEEQHEIGSFFDKLDNCITLHQRKLDQLNQLKEALLQQMFPGKGETVPKLRFAGFEGDWEERKLKNIGLIQTGNTPPTKNKDNYSDTGMLWVTPTDINYLIISDTKKRLSNIGIEKARIAKKGSILVTCIASIGKNALAMTDVGFNQQINSLTPQRGYDSYFLLTQSKIWSETMKNNAASGTMQIVNKTDFSNIISSFPTSEEQRRIGLLFNKVDNTITLQQRKLDQLKNTKQILLQNMFI